MCRIVLTTVFLLCLIISVNAQPQWFWARSFTGSGSTIVSYIYTTGDNKVIAGGYYSGTVNVGENGVTSSGGNDALLVALDTNGNLLWYTAFGGTGEEYIKCITTDSDNNVWITGGFSQTMTLGNFQLTSNGARDIFIAKYNPTDGWLNAVSIGSVYDDSATGVAVDSDGYIYVTGSYRQSITIGATTLTHSYYCCFLSKWDSNLTGLWANQPNTYGQAFAINKLGVDNQDNVYLQGWFDYHCSFNSVNPISLTSQHSDAFAAKFNPSGNCLWAIRIGVGGNLLADAFTLPSGEFFVSCEVAVYPTLDKENQRPDVLPLIAKFNSDGAWQWYDDDNELTYCMSTMMAAHPNGNVFLTGFLLGTQVFGSSTLEGSLMHWEIFVAKANSDGVWQCGLQTTGAVLFDEPRPLDITYLDNDNFALAGVYYNAGATFGNIVIPPANQTSAFIAKGGTEIVSNNDLISTQPGIKLKVYPNPFSDKLRLDFTLNKAKALSAGIYNIKGQCLKHFESAVYSKGKHSIYWDGKTSDGMQTASGVYLIKLQDENRAYSRIIVKK